MPRTCTVCSHPQVAAINSALFAGTPFRTIASQNRLTDASVRRHKENCIRDRVRAVESEEFTETLNQLKSASKTAIKTLERHLTSAKTPAAVQVRAALGILQMAIDIHRLSELEERLAELEETLKQQQASGATYDNPFNAHHPALSR